MATETEDEAEKRPPEPPRKDEDGAGKPPRKRKDEPPHLPPGAMGDWATL